MLCSLKYGTFFLFGGRAPLAPAPRSPLARGACGEEHGPAPGTGQPPLSPNLAANRRPPRPLITPTRAGFVFIMTLFVIFCVPETRGVPIEELNEVIMQKVGEAARQLPPRAPGPWGPG
jgi:hypothetical protein